MAILSGQVYIVTGASSGIGESVARQLAQRGANLILAARHVDKLQTLATELSQDYFVEVTPMYLDLSQREIIEGFVKEVGNRYPKIDGLINSSGLGIFTPVLDVTYEEIDQQFLVNVQGTIYLTTLVAKQMAGQKSGHIVFLASIAGYLITPSSSIYSASKSAIIMYANGLRLELKDYNIKVTTMNPGPVKTAFFSHSQSMKDYYKQVSWLALDPDDLAKAIVGNILKGNHSQRELMRPRYLKVIPALYALLPNTSDYLIRRFMNHKNKKDV